MAVPPPALSLTLAPSRVALPLIHASPAALTLTLSSLAAPDALAASHQKYHCEVDCDHEKKKKTHQSGDSFSAIYIYKC